MCYTQEIILMQMKIWKNETINKNIKAFYTELLCLFSFLYHIQVFHQSINGLKEIKEKEMKAL